jgi:hypothetical protein
MALKSTPLPSSLPVVVTMASKRDVALCAPSRSP